MNVPVTCGGGLHPPFDTVTAMRLQRRGYANDRQSQSIDFSGCNPPL
jgi:hypothetical protein